MEEPTKQTPNSAAYAAARRAQQAPEYRPQRGKTLADLEHTRLEQHAPSFADFGESLQRAQHNYAELDLFTDDALVELLSTHPRRRIQCFTMGDDPTRPQDWQAVCIRKNTGEHLLEAVQRGKIWLNITSPERYDSRYLELVTDMYAHVEKMCPTVVQPELYYNTLVLAAPGTQFYYHVNPENNMLWNMRGNLKLSTLPAMDFRFTPQALLEEIFAHEASGSIAYRPEFEEFAESINVDAGDCAWWPQSAPIRMQYQDFCVGFVTSYYCPMRHRRQMVQLANRYLLRPLGVRNRNIIEDGWLSEAKQLAYRLIDRCITFKKAYDFTDSYITNKRLDLNSPDCLITLDEMVAPEFSKFASMSHADFKAIAGTTLARARRGGHSDNYQFDDPQVRARA